MKSNNIMISHSDIASKIYYIRNKHVMIDYDLAVLYGVETKNLKRAVKSNIIRFPDDFMFELSKSELNNWRCQIGTSNYPIKMGIRRPPFAFTEQGIAMLSSILNSEKAIRVNIAIMRTFIKIKELIITNAELKLLVGKLERRMDNHDLDIEKINNDIKTITALIQQLFDPPKPKKEYKIGFRQD